jgi:4-nitrotryptophan synthase
MEDMVLDQLSDTLIVPDPYPFYERLRTHRPVAWWDSTAAWAVTRYRDCKAILSDDETFQADRMASILNVKFPGKQLPPDNIYFQFVRNTVMWTDPPLHSVLRRSVRPAFSGSAHACYERLMNRAVDELMRDIEGQTEIDAASAIADRLPHAVGVHVFGVPREDLEYVLARTDVVNRFFTGPNPPPVTLDQILDSLTELHTYGLELLQGKRGRVSEGTIIWNCAEASRTAECTPAQMLHQLVLVLVAAFARTTPGMLGHGLLLFAQNPDQVERVLANPDLEGAAVDEILRLHPSNQYTYRLVKKDVELSEMPLKAGQVVIPFLAAANRDPDVFPDPNAFDVGRANCRAHLTFGLGTHLCYGATVVRQEGKAFFGDFLRRYPKLKLAGKPSWNTSLEFRTLKSLPLRLVG